jgi:ClpP class serine protease
MIYARTGLLAIEPSAIGAAIPPIADNVRGPGSVAIVPIRGPIDAAGYGCEDYESICMRVADACATDAVCIVLDIDSPGGVVTGLFEAASQIREMCSQAGKRLVAYVSGQCCSAAYALACAAESITTCSTGLVGSIGVVDCRVDVSRSNEAAGVRYSVVSSGARKTDGHPCVAVSDGELAARQRVVDDMAGVFFAHVQSARGIDVSLQQANVYVGESARAAMLADSVLGYRDFLAALAGPVTETMTYDEIMAALADMARGDGEDAARAAAALSAIQEETSEPAQEPAAMDDERPVEASTVAQLALQVQTLSARLGELTATRECDDRRALLAGRDDLGAELLTVLADKPLAEVRAIVAALPKRARFGASKPPAVTLGEGQALQRAASPEFDRVDALMGIGATKSTHVVRTEHSLILGAARKGA